MTKKVSQRTPTELGVRTFIQALGGLLIGLIAVIWAVPGVPQAMRGYLVDNAVPMLALFSVPSGVIAFLQNKIGK